MTKAPDIGRIPPQNLEAEMSLLGSILLDKESISKVTDQILIGDFYSNAHNDIFAIMLEIYNKNESIDILTVSNRLTEKQLLQKIGGHSYLVKLSNAVPTASHITEYAKIVKRKAVHRKLIAAADKISELGYNEETQNTDEILDEAQQELFRISQKHIGANFTSIQNVLSDAFERIDDLHKDKGKLRGVSTGFRDLDDKLGGLQNSDLIILAARPSVGKTSFCLDIARNAAVRSGMPVGVFSLEMSKEQLVDRMLCAEAGVDLWKMRTGNLSDRPDSDDFPRIGRAMGVLSNAPIFIDDAPGNNVMHIRSKARRLKAEHGLGLIIIDYLQLMTSHNQRNSENRVQEVAEMSRNLKGIARELNVPVLALSQLSRAVEQTKPSIPKLSHLRDSGSIEQDADVVLFIYRKSADRNYRLEDIPPDERNLGEIHIAKHRNGPTGVVQLFFDATRASFKDLDQHFTQPNSVIDHTPPPSITPTPNTAPKVPTF
ncbi:MAG: replicative DNA helicase [Candidatus Magasanikbacteria bacterium]|nr:replicative DNA helicase [Candidatus Magasanikbacteria bacterium]|tara:strand:+ start:1564 stop:3024 length:1461 start_codon:yes stop_codon:yes gene_type:complete